MKWKKNGLVKPFAMHNNQNSKQSEVIRTCLYSIIQILADPGGPGLHLLFEDWKKKIAVNGIALERGTKQFQFIQIHMCSRSGAICSFPRPPAWLPYSLASMHLAGALPWARAGTSLPSLLWQPLTQPLSLQHYSELHISHLLSGCFSEGQHSTAAAFQLKHPAIFLPSKNFGVEKASSAKNSQKKWGKKPLGTTDYINCYFQWQSPEYPF